MRTRVIAIALLGALVLAGSVVSAQQIYRWTDESGKVHFGNQPPPGSKNLETTGRERGEVELECEAAAKGACQQYVDKYGKWWDSEAYRRCLEQGREKCAQLAPKVRPTQAPERFISTPTLAFDPQLGDALQCEMLCPTRCRGKVEIRTDRVLKKGENYGSDRYAMEVKPPQAGSAFCSVSTANENVQVVLSVRRNGAVTATVEAQ